MCIDAFYGLDEPQNLQNVDVMTDAASTVGTTFTRYTVAPSSVGTKKSKCVDVGEVYPSFRS